MDDNVLRSGARLEINESMLDLVCQAIHRVSMRDQRLRTVRQTVVAGLELLITSTMIDRFFLMKNYNRQKLSGNIFIHVSLGVEEGRLLKEVRTLIGDQTLEAMSRGDIMILAILKAATVSAERAPI